MKLQCDFHDDHDLAADLPTGNRCTAEATHRINWADGRFSLACSDHLEIGESATVKPARIVQLLTGKTITDEQIRELRDIISMDPNAISPPPGVDRVAYRAEALRMCERALYSRIYRGARARCAEILNARAPVQEQQ